MKILRFWQIDPCIICVTMAIVLHLTTLLPKLYLVIKMLTGKVFSCCPGVDELLARHVAHLFIRDPVSLFEEKIHQNIEDDVDHFEVSITTFAKLFPRNVVFKQSASRLLALSLSLSPFSSLSFSPSPLSSLLLSLPSLPLSEHSVHQLADYEVQASASQFYHRMEGGVQATGSMFNPSSTLPSLSSHSLFLSSFLSLSSFSFSLPLSSMPEEDTFSPFLSPKTVNP